MHGEIYQAINREVEQYFTDNKLLKTGNWQLHLLALILFVVFLGSYFGWLFLSSNYWFVVLFSLVTGLSAGILGAFGHEAIHRAFAKQKWLNGLMIYFQDFVGKNTFKYTMNHAKHHTFTNVDGIDPDLNLEPMMRLHPHQELRKWHRFQYLYAVLVYSLAAFSTVYDYQNYFIYLKNSALKHKIFYWLSKIWHIFAYLAVPIYILGWQKALLGYVIFMLSAGLYFATIIQPSHLFLGSEFDQPNPETNELNEEWTERMVRVTSNYANGNPLMSMLYAGMDYHIIHQLFPTISMVHFPALNGIIRQKCRELNLPYQEFGSLPVAIVYHLKYLKQVGNLQNIS
jgi:linoleoyl-CoA desaturase